MPHQCTNCGKIFPDGSKEMLSGCPQCGGNKFQFRPRGQVESGSDPAPTPSSEAPDTSQRPEQTAQSGGDDDQSGRDSGSVGEWVRQRADQVMGSSSEPGPSKTGGSPSPPETTETPEPSAESAETLDSAAGGEAAEDRAQASARSDVVSPDELARATGQQPRDDGRPADVDGTVIEPQSEERPGLDELREELNDQFESIKILDRGQYELNLMELYDREEYIISLQEDGRYVIEVPDSWRSKSDDEDE